MFDLQEFVTHVVERLDHAEWTENPYGHTVIDDFLPEEIARQISAQCDEPNLQRFVYDSPLERKDTSNQWNQFSSELYAAFGAMNHIAIARSLIKLTKIPELFLDAGLHGGGIHRTKKGGRLNLHIDYAIHPMLRAERRLNVIIYLNKNWHSEWGGQLQLWHGKEKPEQQFASIEPTWNRAAIFATGSESWHGFPEPLTSPELTSRNSLAMYYCTFPSSDTPRRFKANFVPAADQIGDKAVEELCQKRVNQDTAAEAYRTGK